MFYKLYSDVKSSEDMPESGGGIYFQNTLQSNTQPSLRSVGEALEETTVSIKIC